MSNKTIEKLSYETKFEDGTEITSYLATAYAEGFCEGGGASSKDIIRAWSYLIGTKLCYSLQGFFGRTAKNMIEAGYIADNGMVDWDLINEE